MVNKPLIRPYFWGGLRWGKRGSLTSYYLWGNCLREHKKSELPISKRNDASSPKFSSEIHPQSRPGFSSLKYEIRLHSESVWKASEIDCWGTRKKLDPIRWYWLLNRGIIYDNPIIPIAKDTEISKYYPTPEGAFLSLQGVQHVIS